MKRIALIAMFFWSPTWAEVGQIVQAEGGVIIRGSDTMVAEEGMVVDQGDLLQTTPTGLIHVLMSDETKFVVGPGTAISIDTALIGASGNTFESLAVGMTAGLFRMKTGNSGSAAYQVTTPVATMGVRGTAFDTCLAREHLLVMYEGVVRTCLLDPATGQPDLASCTDSEAVEDACPIVSALEDPNGERSISLANSTAILQCRLAYQQEELGVLEDFRVDDRACRAVATSVRGNRQPDSLPPEDVLPLEEEEDGDDPQPENGEDEASGSSGRTFTTTTRLQVIEGGFTEVCSRSELLEVFADRVDYYEELIEQAADDATAFSYEAALRTLLTIIDDLRSAPLAQENCAALLALLTTHCGLTASPAAPEDKCIISGLNYGLGTGD